MYKGETEDRKKEKDAYITYICVIFMFVHALKVSKQAICQKNSPHFSSNLLSKIYVTAP